MTKTTAAPVTPGILIVDKPLGPTSHDLVQQARRAAHTRRVGHAGTLDPQASGLMILGIGAATRLLTYLVGLDKTYLATIRLGVATTTDDAAGEPIGQTVPVSDAVLARVPAALAGLTGDVDQVPSTVSAIHVDGRRAHELARAGETVVLAPRRVRIDRIDVVAVRAADVTVEGSGGADIDVIVDCSSGTYIRAIARDLGAALGVGGHLAALRRSRVGPFTVDEATPLEDPLTLLAPGTVAARLFPTVQLDATQTRDLSQGKRVALPTATDGTTPPPIAALAPDGRLIGLARIEEGSLRTIVNFPEAVAE